MSIFESILPKNSCMFEKNLERAANFPSLPIAELADLVNPWAIDARYLPWLAFRFNIEIWQDNWGEEKKRSVIARALELQRIKGTKRGLREYVRLVDGEIKQILTAPQHYFAGRGLSAAEIASWHDTMPQIRIYHVNKRMSAKGFSFFNHSFFGKSFATPNIGRALYGRQAVFWDRGKTTALKMIDLNLFSAKGQAVQAEQVSLPGLAQRRCFFSGGFANVGFIAAIVKKPEIITWNRDIDYIKPQAQVSTTSLTPSLQPLDVRAQRKSEKWIDKYSFSAGRFSNLFFLTPNIAGHKLYDGLILHDRTRALPKRQGLSFTDVNKLGFPAYRAHILVDLQQKANSRSFFVGLGFIGRHVVFVEDKTKREAQSRAIVLSKAARDKIMVTFQTTRALRFGDSPSFNGNFQFNARPLNRL